MKYQALRAFTRLALAVGFLVAGAGAQTGKVSRINIPFAFVVDQQTLPAGEYSLAFTDANVLVVRDERGRSRFVITNRFDVPGETGEPSVQFEVVDGRHILTEFKDGNSGLGGRVLRTRAATEHSSLSRVRFPRENGAR